MNSFKRCLKKKLPYSLLIYPCIPCIGDGNNSYLFLASITCILMYFVTKLIYRNNINMVDYLNNNTWVPCLFVIIYSLIMSIIITILITKRHYDNKKFKLNKLLSTMINSIGIGILLFLAGIASLKVYDVLYYLPIVGPILTSILGIFESYLGSNTPRIMASWWGIALSWLLVFIPLVGPYIGSFMTLIPQNQLLLYIGYIITCQSQE